MTQRIVGNPIITFIDFLSIVIGAYGFQSTILTLPLPPHLVDAGHWQFLTNLSLVYSLVVFVVGFIAHITKSERLFSLKNNLHPIGLALESIVSIVYWPLRLFCLRLLVEDTSLYPIPMSADLAVHLMPVVSLLIDYFIFMPRWTIKTKTALGICFALTGAYWCLLEYLVDVENGSSYPYAFLNVPHNGLRAFIFVIVGGAAFVQFLIMSKIYSVLVESPQDSTVEDISKKEI